MRAARFLGDGRIQPAEAPAPGLPDGDCGATLRVLACALCGSDLRPWRQGWPVTPGHEVVGRVDQPGHAMHGARALAYIPAFCGRCGECRAGRTNTCETMPSLLGWQVPGGYADAVAVPGQCLMPVPDWVPDRLAPLLLDTIGTAAHGIRQAGRVVEPGPALVLGAGPIGLGAILVLRRLGFGPIHVVDPAEYRRGFAISLGAKPADPADLPRRVTLVVEASGKDAARQSAMEAVAPGGAVLQLGESDAWQVAETRPIRRKDFFLIRSFYFPIGDLSANLELLRADQADYARLVDDAADLQGLEALFAAFARGERLKPVFVPA